MKRRVGLDDACAERATARLPDPLDRRQLASIERVLGSDRTAGLLALFARELQSRPLVIRQAIARNDFAAARGEAHSLKGVAMNFGAPAVGTAAARLERVSAAGGASDLHQSLRTLDRAVALTLAALPPSCAAG